MLSLPSKPWKKVKITLLQNGLYQLQFVSQIKTAREFQNILEKIKGILVESDEVILTDFEGRKIKLRIVDFISFKRKLVFINISVVNEGS